MLPSHLPCPDVGHRSFEKSISAITVGDADTPYQISKFIRPYTCVSDGLNIGFAQGELQKSDMATALSLFAYSNFICNTFKNLNSLFRHSQCRIYQFQTVPKSGKPFIFGMFITDGNHNLIDYCVDSHLAHKRKPVLLRLIRAICTSESIALKLTH